MKTQIITWLCCCLVVLGFSQSIDKIEYFFNTDPGFDSGIGITPNANSGNLTQTTNISIGSLTGFNSLYVRAMDNTDTWTIYEKRIFYVTDFVPTVIAGEITAAEYFFNSDPGFGSGTSLLPIDPNTGDLTQSYVITVPSSLTGFNSLYIRTKDEFDVWSIYEKRIFYVTDFTPIIGATEIDRAEYFFNTDPGFDNGTDITINPKSGDVTQIIDIPTNLPVGFNSLYIRVLDDLGVWSLYEKRIFYVEDTADLTVPTITGAEYFYDSDPGFGNGYAASITQAGNPDEFTIDLGTSMETCDLHDFYIRLQNSDGTWSLYDYSFDLDIFDNAPPTIVVFPNITAELDANGQASITLVDVDNGTYDDCELVSVVLNQSQFDYSCSDLGVNSVTITATDAEAKVSNQNVDITVVDLINPIAVAQNITVQLDANGEATITGAQIDNGSTDNCSVTNFSLDVSSFDCNDLGTNIVTLTAIDQSGNNSTNAPTAMVTIEDNIDPIVVTQNLIVQLDSSGNASITAAQVDNNSTDNCTINNRSLDISSFTCANLGGNTVTLTITDQSGNTAMNTATITVEDNINPVAIGQDITRDLAGNPSVTITAVDIDNGSSDNCSFSLGIDVDTFNSVGVYPVILTVTDGSGNIHTTTVMVTIEDSLGVEDFKISEKNIKLYPVPASESLYISTKLIIDTVDILDLGGRNINKITKPNALINIENLSSGVYFLKFRIENQIVTKRFVKE